MRGKTFGYLVAAVVALTFCLVPSKSRASSLGEEILLGAFVGAAVLSVPSFGLVAAVQNLYYVIKGERAPSGVRLQGWVFGGLNIALGATALLVGFYLPDKDNLLPQFSTLFFGVGAMDIGFTVWSSSQPERKSRLTVNPIVMQDIEGNPAVGIGLNLVNW